MNRSMSAACACRQASKNEQNGRTHFSKLGPVTYIAIVTQHHVWCFFLIRNVAHRADVALLARLEAVLAIVEVFRPGVLLRDASQSNKRFEISTHEEVA